MHRHNSTTPNFTPLSAIKLAEVSLTADAESALLALPQPVQQLVNDTVKLAQRSKALAESYQQLHLEAELLRAERDRLAEQLSGLAAPALH